MSITSWRRQNLRTSGQQPPLERLRTSGRGHGFPTPHGTCKLKTVIPLTTFEEALSVHFPGAFDETTWVTATHAALVPHGFASGNCIPIVSVCRDEISRPLGTAVRATWGSVFDASSLAGMLFLGKTGFIAIEHHAPRQDGWERYLFYAAPHIAFGPKGEPGLYFREGRAEPSSACGALLAFLQEMEAGHLKLEFDPHDVEQSLLKQHLMRRVRYGRVPTLVELTKIAHEAILHDLEQLIRLAVKPQHSHYAVFTGVQIHGPGNRNYIWLRTAYCVLAGQRHALEIAPHC